MQAIHVESSMFCRLRPSAIAHSPFIFLAGVSACDLFCLVTGAVTPWALSFWALLVGLLLAVPATIVGLWDCSRLSDDHPDAHMASHHMTLLLGAVGEFSGSLLVRSGSAPPLWPGFAFATSFIGLLLLVLGALHGGALLLGQGGAPVDKT